MNFQSQNFSVAEIAAQLANEGEHVVLVKPDGKPFTPHWSTEPKTPAHQLVGQLKSWRDAKIRIVRDGKLIDPFAPPAPEAPKVEPEPAWEPPGIEAPEKRANAHEAEPAANAPPHEPEPASAHARGDCPHVTYTVMTSAGGALTKRYNLMPDGALSKAQNPNFVGGYAGVFNKPLHDILDGLSDQQCLVGGIPGRLRPLQPGEGIKVVPQKQLPQNVGSVARTKEFFGYRPGVPALMLFDVDPNHSAVPPVPGTTPCEANDGLIALFPGLKGAAAYAAPSASSGRYIREADGAVVREKYGSHNYFVAEDGSDIPRAGEVAFKRMVLAGRGSIALAKNGALLVRGMFDAAVFSGERIDYCAPANVGPGIRVEGRPEPVKILGGCVDTRAVFRDLAPEEEKAFEREIKRLKAAIPGDRVKAKREAFEDEMVERMTKRGASHEQAREYVKTMRPGYRGSLGAGVVLVFDDFGEITVAEVLTNLAKFNDATLADPVEGVEYGEGKARLYVNDDGTVVINSFAHGGQIFTLRNAAEAEKAAADETAP